MAFDPFLDAFCTLQRYGRVREATRAPEWIVRNENYGHSVSLYFNRKNEPVLAVDSCGRHKARSTVIRSAEDIRRFNGYMSRLRMSHSPSLLEVGYVSNR